jgi:hypothetical protein
MPTSQAPDRTNALKSLMVAEWGRHNPVVGIMSQVVEPRALELRLLADALPSSLNVDWSTLAPWKNKVGELLFGLVIEDVNSRGR